MKDFTLDCYRLFLEEAYKASYAFKTFEASLAPHPIKWKSIVLRHDVDQKPKRSCHMATIENELAINGTYYFRNYGNDFPVREIKEIFELGHEIGYHYEDLSLTNGDLNRAYASFARNLERLRRIAPVRTACMHGSPLSKYDNREMWKKRSYKDLGILGEPYFDVDFNKVLYLTDTGRRWDGEQVSVRDRVDSRQKTEDSRGEVVRKQKTEDEEQKTIKRPRLHSTQDIINALKNNTLPDQIMMTIHPQRWTDEWGPWVWELVNQKIKNVVKYFVIMSRR